MLIKHWRALRRTYLPEQPGKHPDGPPLSVANIIALALVLAIILGVVPSILPGSSYDTELDRELEAIAESNWTIPLEYGCTVDMPHGKKRCSAANIDGTTITTTGY